MKLSRLTPAAARDREEKTMSKQGEGSIEVLEKLRFRGQYVRSIKNTITNVP